MNIAKFWIKGDDHGYVAIDVTLRSGQPEEEPVDFVGAIALVESNP